MSVELTKIRDIWNSRAKIYLRRAKHNPNAWGGNGGGLDDKLNNYGTTTVLLLWTYTTRNATKKCLMST